MISLSSNLFSGISNDMGWLPNGKKIRIKQHIKTIENDSCRTNGMTEKV